MRLQRPGIILLVILLLVVVGIAVLVLLGPQIANPGEPVQPPAYP